MAAQPRVAVIGGGVAGTLCSLVLKNRGITPVLIDAGRGGMGGRLRGNGAQFLRAADPRLLTVVQMLEREGVLAQWKGRFGMLGSSGGFLPAEVVTRNTGFGGGNSTQAMGRNDDGGIVDCGKNDDAPAATDAGDFCHFVDGSTIPTYVGVPSMTHMCPEICRLAGIEEVNNSSLVSAKPALEGGWILDVRNNSESNNLFLDPHEIFDALVLATHDPSVAAAAIRAIVDAEVSAGNYDNTREAVNAGDDASLVIGRLAEIADSLQVVRDNHRIPVYAISMKFPAGFSNEIPFDSVSIPGSALVQFLARDASKPGASELPQDLKEETWTAITTSRLATSIMNQINYSEEEKLSSVSLAATKEISGLLAQYHNGATPEPLQVTVKRWGAAFCSQGLQLKEDSICLAPWRLTVCGDFIRDQSAYNTPIEAAALSGLEAGERTAAFWAQEESQQ